ncbi:MAG: phosphodiesterase [Rhodospirillales bacterium]|nr:phosphodiesterase [Rhodospirillales bacterium]
MKFVHITDTHLVTPGEKLYELDPYERLVSCIDDVLAHHADAAFCVITGDLAHRGELAAYEGMARQLARLPMPVYPLLGNHDLRGPFVQAFPLGPRDVNGFVQTVLDRAEGRFLFLDTLDEGVNGGRYCDRRSEWLRARLAEAGERAVFLFMHHPPFSIGIPCVDAIALAEPERFAQLVDARRNIRHLFYGHVHRPVCGSWHGIPVSTMRGLNHQVPFDLHTVEPVPKSHEPPAYAVVFVDPAQVTVHFHDFLDRRTLVKAGEHYEYAP